ncbi:MAG: Fur family transcriptional regulator [Candidatus Hydrogenedentota bacterium]
MSDATKQRMTPQRRRILDELRGRHDHPTAEAVYEAVRADLPRVSLGTVYRNLDVLVRNGRAVRIDHGGAQARFDADTHPHYHVTCVNCGRVDDVDAPPLESLLRSAVSVSGYQITGVIVSFHGICALCQKSAGGG